MVKQGDIIKVSFNPQKGHEQAGYRPAVIVSSDKLNKISNDLAIVCPITNTKKAFPLHVELDNRTKTTGSVLCDHIRTLDLSTRGYSFIETIPHDLLIKIIDIIALEVEI